MGVSLLYVLRDGWLVPTDMQIAFHISRKPNVSQAGCEFFWYDNPVDSKLKIVEDSVDIDEPTLQYDHLCD